MAAWQPDTYARLTHRLGASPQELGVTEGRTECPDVWELDNGDVAVVGRDLTGTYASSLPEGLVIGSGERLVVIPRATFLSAARGGLNA